jgi:5-hydroxyisourate hydrolase
MTHISTHVLDAVRGRPAAGVPVTLYRGDGTVLAHDETDDDGRIADLATGELLGVHHIRFDTAAYFAAQQIAAFYPEIVIAFDVTDADGKYHVPVLLSPYAYSTYRGS